MRQGCISLGEIKCDMCQRLIPNPERYLATDIDEKTGGEVASGGKTVRYCVECCLKQGYAGYREERGGKILTFFPEKGAKEEKGDGLPLQIQKW